ncbi:Cytochrome f [Spatholobus suberectus]|nr:Cytochrome f [Spatholobus suberectus]
MIKKSYEKKNGYKITIVDALDGREVIDIILPGPELLVLEGESIKLDQSLTSNPNVSGFRQRDAKIVLQDLLRVQSLLLGFVDTRARYTGQPAHLGLARKSL